jgi:outer membrane protein, heavy metal efflux system
LGAAIFAFRAAEDGRPHRGERREQKVSLVNVFRASQAAFCWGLGVVAIGGCARVEPAQDYGRARDLIRQQTGNEAVYDPGDESVVQAKVEELLQGGLTVDKAVSLALLNSPAFQSLFLDIGASRADLVQSSLFINPTLSFGGLLPEGGGRSRLVASGAQQIVDLWQIPVRKRIAQAQLEQTVLLIAFRATTFTAEVKSQYYQVLAMRQAESITKEHVTLVEESVDLVQRRFNAGEASFFDVNLAKANVVDARLELVDLARQRQVAEAGLLHMMGLSRRLLQCVYADSLSAPAPLGTDYATLLFLADSQRLDAQVVSWKVNAAEDEVVREYLRIFPDIAMGFDFERIESRALPGRTILADTARDSVAAGTFTAPAIQSRGQRNLERGQIIDSVLGPSITATLPIMDQNQAQIAKARVRALQARKDQGELLDQIAQQVRQSLAVAQSSAELVRMYEVEGLPQARDNVEGSRSVFQAGEQSVLILIEAQEILIRREIAHVNALRDLAAAMAQLESAIGGPLPAGGEPAATRPSPQ